MLVLQRYRGQSIQIGEDILVTVLSHKKGGTQIGIQAPERINIVREELKTQSNAKKHLFNK